MHIEINSFATGKLNDWKKTADLGREIKFFLFLFFLFDRTASDGKRACNAAQFRIISGLSQLER